MRDDLLPSFDSSWKSSAVWCTIRLHTKHTLRNIVFDGSIPSFVKKNLKTLCSVVIYKVSQAVNLYSWRKKVRKCKDNLYTSYPRPLLSLHSFRKWFVFSWVFCVLGYFKLSRNLKPSHSQWYSLPHPHLKGQCHGILTSGFYESVSPMPLSIQLGQFQIFWKFVEIVAAQGEPLVSLTMEKILNQKNFNYFVPTPLGSRVNI